jgi:hypothetical protein
MFVIIDRTTKRVLGFTEREDYAQEHPDQELIPITEDHELVRSEKPQDYVYNESTQSFIYSPQQT